MKHFLLPLLGAALLLGGAPALRAATTVIWTGAAGDGLFATGSNWQGGAAPANNNYGSDAEFTGTAGIVTLSSARSVHGLIFDTSGWTLTGSQFNDLGPVGSYGAGTNILSSAFQLTGSTTWTVGTGNTLYLTNTSVSSVYLRSNTITLTGGGTLLSDAQIYGYGSGSYGITVQNATLRFNIATPINSNSSAAISLTGAGAVLELKTTVSAAQSLISTGKIVDGLGSGLSVTDIGGGYVRINAVPEPSALLLFLAAAAWLGRRVVRAA